MKISQNDLKRIINEEIQALKEENNLENMNYEQLREAILAKMARDLGGKLWNKLKTSFSNITSSTVTGFEELNRVLLNSYEEAQKAELEQIKNAAREEAKIAIKNIITKYKKMAVNKGIPRSDTTMLLLLAEIIRELSDPSGEVLPPGPPSASSSISGASLGRAAVGEE